MTKIISIIPARKGSKGIPNKNLINLSGKPLIHYAIQASKQSIVDETWVSSDSDEILNISKKLGIEKVDVQLVVESLMNEITSSLENGENVYLRGFGSFIVKRRAEKTARNIKKNTTIKIPAHNIPAFKPSKIFLNGVKNKLKVN